MTAARGIRHPSLDEDRFAAAVLPAGDPGAWAAVVRHLRGGGAAIVPTDTVYGLVALLRARSIDRIFRLKGRARGKPLIVLVQSRGAAERCGAALTDAERRLARRHWPGGLTLLLRVRRRGLLGLLHARGHVGFRVPARPWLRSLLARTGPLASTSANRSGTPPARSARALDPRLVLGSGLAVDGGRSSGRPSTVARVRGDRVEIVRAGAVSRRTLERSLRGRRSRRGVR